MTFKTNKNIVRIMIIGTGQIGKRHLQAMSNLTINIEILCYDYNKNSLDTIETFITENSIVFKNIYYLKDYKQMLNQIDSNTIVVIATTANGRFNIVNDVLLKKPKAVVSEKPLTQSTKEFSSVLKRSSEVNIPVYVNFFSHLQPYYQEIFENNNCKELVSVNTYLPKWGLATVGIHHFDLIAWFSNAKQLRLISSTFKVKYEQKRKGFYDFSGSVFFESDTGVTCFVNNSLFSGTPSVQFIYQDCIFNIYEDHPEPFKVTVVSVNLYEGTRVKVYDFIHVSQYMHTVVESIMNPDKKVSLPKIEQGELGHSLLFDYMKHHKLQKENIT